MSIYLASTSPRRKELLATIVPAFESVAPEIEEKEYSEMEVKDRAIRRSKDKCIAGINKIREKGMVVVASDTVVDLNGVILDKPKTKKEAYSMIKSLSGNTHTVYTAVSIYKDAQMYTFCEKTDVTFKDVPEQFIEEYIQTDEPYDKAGGYAIQGRMADYIEKIDGDYFNVVGLPLAHLKKLLSKLNAI